MCTCSTNSTSFKQMLLAGSGTNTVMSSAINV